MTPNTIYRVEDDRPNVASFAAFIAGRPYMIAINLDGRHEAYSTVVVDAVEKTFARGAKQLGVAFPEPAVWGARRLTQADVDALIPPELQP